MLKHADSSPRQYRTQFAPLPVATDETLYFDRQPIKLPYAEDFPMLHYHDRYEIGICERGEGLFLSEGRFFLVSKGDAIFIPPGQCHYSRSFERDAPCICRFAYLPASRVRQIVSLSYPDDMKGEGGFKERENRIPSVIRVSEYPQAAAMLWKTLDACTRETADSTALAFLKLSVFLLEAREICSVDPSDPDVLRKEDGAVTAIAEYLSLNYHCADTARELATKCHLSESQLRRRFLTVYGMPPIAYRSLLRCKIAAEILAHTRTPISEITERIGYTASSDFYRAFKKIYGVSPSAYRMSAQLSAATVAH